MYHVIICEELPDTYDLYLLEGHEVFTDGVAAVQKAFNLANQMRDGARYVRVNDHAGKWEYSAYWSSETGGIIQNRHGGSRLPFAQRPVVIIPHKEAA